MSFVKLRSKAQITIPKDVVSRLQLSDGDILDVEIKNKKIVLTPKQLAEKPTVAKLSAAEQKVLRRAQVKIEAINNDLLHSKGLTSREIEIASKAGAIDPDQAYFWTEEWQKNERKTESDIQNDRLSPSAHDASELLQQLNQLKRT